MAATGFQRRKLTIEEIHEEFMKVIKTNTKELLFIQHQLRSGKDIFLHGGNVTSVYSDQVFRLLFDNKRIIEEKTDRTDLLDSKPLPTSDLGSLLRYIGKLPKTVMYTKNLSNSLSGRYKRDIDLASRNFVRALLNNELNLDKSNFKNYSQIVEYLKDYNDQISINENSIALLKRRSYLVKIPKTEASKAFIAFIKQRFPNFDEDNFHQ